MKANRKFLRGDEEAVSPVIAVILMVAITVVLAATVYVWVSGFGSSGTSAQKSMALTSNGPIASGVKSFTVASATPGMRWSDISVSLEGTTYAISTAPTAACNAAAPNPEASRYQPCSNGLLEASTATIDAGDLFYIDAATGNTLRLLDAGANSVMLTLTVS